MFDEYQDKHPKEKVIDKELIGTILSRIVVKDKSNIYFVLSSDISYDKKKIINYYC